MDNQKRAKTIEAINNIFANGTTEQIDHFIFHLSGMFETHQPPKLIAGDEESIEQFAIQSKENGCILAAAEILEQFHPDKNEGITFE